MKQLFAVLVCVAAFLGSISPASAKDYREVLDSYTLTNNYGKDIPLSSFANKPVIVLAFIGTECPLAKLYGPRLNQIQQKFGDQGVQILGIASNTQDSLTELTAYVNRHEIKFPVLKDLGNKLADAVEATRTPEVFVLDAQRVVRYQGRIDDQYGVGYAKPESNKSDLSIALSELLAGKPVSIPRTDAIGCFIGRVKEKAAKGNITFTKDVAPILNARCVECHREGELAPFTLTSYEDVLGWEDTMLEVIADNRMPPWHADPNKSLHFSNDTRLSEKEKATLRTWVENGMPEGDASDMPPPPKFVDGWRIPEPDEIFEMEEAFNVPAEGTVDYQRFMIDPGYTEDKYVIAAEARPGNRSVVHHIILYFVPPGERRWRLTDMVVGYAPGSVPVELEEGVAMKIPAGSRYVFEVHYTPNGSPQTDRSYVGVRYADKKDVEKELKVRIAADNKLRIPPNADNHPVEADYLFRQDEMLVSLMPHMHLRGKSFDFIAKYPDGTSESLLDVPNYDFNWQTKYILAEPKLMPSGTRIECKATYNNSESNLVNPNPNKWIHWGEQSWDEMMIGFLETIPTK